MTTDTFAKEAAVERRRRRRTYTVGGMAKGSGMIAPNMATMLAVITTDAPLTTAACDAALRSAVGTHLQPRHGRLGHLDQRHGAC